MLKINLTEVILIESKPASVLQQNDLLSSVEYIKHNDHPLWCKYIAEEVKHGEEGLTDATAGALIALAYRYCKEKGGRRDAIGLFGFLREANFSQI